MSAKTVKSTAEAEVRELLDSWFAAILAADISAIMSHYAPDTVAYDAVQQLQFLGTEAYGRHWQSCLEMCPGPMIFEPGDVTVVAGDDVAYSHGLVRCGGTDKDGNTKTSWMRFTSGYRKAKGKWAIYHEHFSAPFDMESGKALFELEP